MIGRSTSLGTARRSPCGKYWMAQSRFFWCHTMPTIMSGNSSGIQMLRLKTVVLYASKNWFILTPLFSKLQTFHWVGRLFESGLAVHGHDSSEPQIQMNDKSAFFGVDRRIQRKIIAFSVA